ncbi:MAG: hypothetical protein EXS47_01095 [Candidatus Zambryskibacteria bacterium]|nr:hypothetical protein [Candidatus Zambryskibacteria bacterium]
MDREKMFSIVGLVLVVGAVVGYSIFDLGKSSKTAVNEVKSESVAVVNGVAIPRDQYDTQLSSVLASLKTQGVDVSTEAKVAEVRTQVLNDFINNELVAQGVIKAGITPTAEEVEKQYQAILTQAGGAEGMKAELVKANLTDAQLRLNITKQLAVQAYLLKNINMASITVTDAEVAQFYKEYSAANKNVSPLKDLSAQIKQQITVNKQQALVANFVASLRTGASIETTLK